MFLHVCKRTFRISKVRISLRVKGVIMQNLRVTVFFFMKTNLLQNFHICISAPLKRRSIFLVQTSFSPMLVENDRNLIVAKMFLTYTIITEKSLRRLTFQSVVLQAPATLLKKRLWHRCFPVNFAKFLKTPFFTEHLWWLFMEVFA